jgi:hypothetical protein
MNDDDAVGIPEETEELILNSLEKVIGLLEGFRDIFEGFASFRKCLLEMSDGELKAILPPDMIEGMKIIGDDQIEEQFLQPARDIDKAINVLNQLKSPNNIQLFKIASSDYFIAIGRFAGGMDKLRRFLEGKSTL